MDGEPPEPTARRWPFGVGQTVVLLVVCVVAAAAVAGVVGWQLGGRDDSESFNSADAGFLEDMIVHHNGAVALGFEYLPRGDDPTVEHFAREIISTQSAEMAVMNLLIDDAGNPETATNGVAMEWMGSPMSPSAMPGMASDADYAELRGSRGIAADEVFTRLMIRHHAAGIAMAKRAAADGENPRVGALARSMAKVQRTEVAEMNRRRVALGLPPVDPSDVLHSHDHMH